MVPMIPTMETISVVCLTEDQEDGDLILDLMVDGINKVSYFVMLFFFKKEPYPTAALLCPVSKK
jgi:hypothetical protein